MHNMSKKEKTSVSIKVGKMQIKYIELTLTDGEKNFLFEDLISKNNNVVLLGVPGSGKSVLLNHFYESHKDECELVRVKEFVKMPVLVKSTTKYFLIDGLDELRCASKEKESIIYDIVAKLKEIEEKCHTLISCREMDWYGDNDDAALQKYLTYPVKKAYVAPLSDEQKESFAKTFLEDKAESVKFISKVLGNNENSELLNIPQTLVMLLELYRDHPSEVPLKKIELYKKIVCLALEKKKTQLRESSCLSEDEVFKYAGYIAYFYMFSDFDNLDDEYLQEISDSSKYEIEKLQQVTRLNIFDNKPNENSTVNKKFSHRTLAEYLCAYFLSKNCSEKDVLNWIVSKNKKIPSELRGVFAWYCSLTESEECFSIDPYGQYVYGDNSLFNWKNKEKVVRAIGRYADEIKPYFMHFGEAYRKKDFYEPRLDKFLISEFRAGLEKKNNYLLFLGFVMTNEDNPTVEILNFAKEIVSKPDLEYHFKEMFIRYFANDVIYLLELLKRVIDGGMQDSEDQLLDRLLSLLYPQIVKPSEIVSYLKKYKKHDCHYNQFMFLNKNKITEQEAESLVLSFYEKKNLKLRENSDLLNVIETFVGEYLFNLLVSKEPQVFLQKLVSLSQMDFNLTNGAWYSNVKRIQSVDENVKQQLYFNYLVNTTAKDLNQVDEFWARKFCSQSFVETLLPHNCFDIQKKLLQDAETNDFRLEILYEMYRRLRSDSKTSDAAFETVCKIAKRYGLLDRFKNGATYTPSPEIAEMMRKNQERNQKRKEEIQCAVNKNKIYFESLTQDEKNNLWGWLVPCASFFLISNENEVENELHISLDIYKELLLILKDKLFQEPEKRAYFEDTNIRALVKNSPSAVRNVDSFYYAMLCLNGPQNYEKIHDEDFLEYLYLIALQEKNVVNSKDSDFLSWFESKNFDTSVKIVQKFILMFFEKEANVARKLSSFFDNAYFKCQNENEKKTYLKNIQSVVYFTEKGLSKQEEIVDKLMRVFNFQLDVDLLNAFTLNDNLSAKRNSLVKILKKDFSRSKTDVENLIEIFGFRWRSFSIKSIIEDYQLVFIESMMHYFDTDESMTFHSGILSYKDEAAFFVNNVMLKQIDGVEGKELLSQLLKRCKNNLWIPRIQTRIAEIDEVLTDNLKTKKTIDEAKEWILKIKEESKVSITINGNVKNSAIVGSANQSPVTISAENGIDFDKVLNIIDQITSNISNAGFSDDQKLTIQSDIQKIKEAVESKKTSTIRSLFNHVIEVCKGTTGNLIATGIIGLIETI